MENFLSYLNQNVSHLLFREFLLVGFTQSLKITAELSFKINISWEKLKCLWRLQLITGEGISSLWKNNYSSKEIRYLGRVVYFETNTNPIMRTLGFTLPILTVQDSNIIWQTNRTLSMSLKIKFCPTVIDMIFTILFNLKLRAVVLVLFFFLQITSEEISFILIYIVLTSIICSVINLQCRNNTTRNFLIISKCGN